MSLGIRLAQQDDREWVATTLMSTWGSVWQVARGRLYDASAHDALIAWLHDERVGLLTYQVIDDALEVTTMPDVVAESRKIKPEIPQIRHDGIPLRDELELELCFTEQ